MPELRDSSTPIPPSPVIKADPDLQDALVEVPHRVSLVDPNSLERLVLLEELLPVELLDALKQCGGGRIVAAHRAAGRGLLDARLQAELWPAPAEARIVSPSGDAAGSSR